MQFSARPGGGAPYKSKLDQNHCLRGLKCSKGVQKLKKVCVEAMFWWAHV